MVDTNIAIHAMDGMDAILDRFVANEGNIVLSALSLTELQRGVYKQPLHTALRKARMDILIRSIPVLPYDARAAEIYGQIIAQCGWLKGRDFDRMIAAHAIASTSVLVTNNLSDFRDIPGLMVEDWVV